MSLVPIDVGVSGAEKNGVGCVQKSELSEYYLLLWAEKMSVNRTIRQRYLYLQK